MPTLTKKKLEQLASERVITDEMLDGLDWDALKYLKDRGKLTPSQETAVGFHPHREGGSFPPGERPGDIDEFAAMARRQATQQGLNPDDETSQPPAADEDLNDEEEEPEDEGDNYDDLTKAQLQEEVDRRNEFLSDDDKLQRNGTRAELIVRLREDDELESTED